MPKKDKMPKAEQEPDIIVEPKKYQMSPLLSKNPNSKFYASSAFQNSPDPSVIPLPQPALLSEGENNFSTSRPSNSSSSNITTTHFFSKTESLLKVLNISPPIL